MCPGLLVNIWRILPIHCSIAQDLLLTICLQFILNLKHVFCAFLLQNATEGEHEHTYSISKEGWQLVKSPSYLIIILVCETHSTLTLDI